MSSETIPLYASRVRHFKSPYPRMAIVLGLLALFLIVEVVNMVFTVMEISLIEYALAGGTVSEEVVAANDQRVMVAALFYLAAYSALAIGFLFWVYRATSNMWDMTVFGEGPPKFTPGWAVGWWFVPFGHLWQPMQVMRELWSRSHPFGVKVSCVKALTIAWWLVWTIGNFMSWYYLFGKNSATLEEMQSDNMALLTTEGFQLVAGVLMGILVWQISRQQVRRRTILTDIQS